MNHGICQTVTCAQHQIDHTYQQEFGVIGWVLHQLNDSMTGTVMNLVQLLVHLLVIMSYGAAFLGLALVVLYANFGQRIRWPQVLIYAENQDIGR